MIVIKNFIQIIAFVTLTVMFFNPQTALGQFFYMENDDIGKRVKDFTLKVVNGKEVNLNEFRDGKKMIIFFWATWCPHCRTALKEMNKDIVAIEKKGIKIAAVDVGEKEPIVNKYMTKNEINVAVFLDEESAISDEYGLIGVPTFYFVNEQGVVTDVQHSLPENLDEVFSKI